MPFCVPLSATDQGEIRFGPATLMAAPEHILAQIESLSRQLTTAPPPVPPIVFLVEDDDAEHQQFKRQEPSPAVVWARQEAEAIRARARARLEGTAAPVAASALPAAAVQQAGLFSREREWPHDAAPARSAAPCAPAAATHPGGTGASLQLTQHAAAARTMPAAAGARQHPEHERVPDDEGSEGGSASESGSRAAMDGHVSASGGDDADDAGEDGEEEASFDEGEEGDGDDDDGDDGDESDEDEEGEEDDCGDERRSPPARPANGGSRSPPIRPACGGNWEEDAAFLDTEQARGQLRPARARRRGSPRANLASRACAGAGLV